MAWEMLFAWKGNSADQEFTVHHPLVDTKQDSASWSSLNARVAEMNVVPGQRGACSSVSSAVVRFEFGLGEDDQICVPITCV